LVPDIKEHKLGVFEKMVLRRTFGPKRGEMMRGCRKLHNEELSSRSIIRMIKSSWMRWAGHVDLMGGKRTA
jgi:hypothetical protein